MVWSLVGSEMCIRDSDCCVSEWDITCDNIYGFRRNGTIHIYLHDQWWYTTDGKYNKWKQRNRNCTYRNSRAICICTYQCKGCNIDHLFQYCYRTKCNGYS